MDYKNILEEIFTRNRFHIDLGLERIEEALQQLDNPHKDLRVIHIAGTNGKGSTASMIKAILQRDGYKVGIFTSPFLSDFRESIRVNDKLITEEEVIAFYEKMMPFCSELTYFEFKTAMAFLYFKKHNIDFAVVEVGLGGRLDATNVVSPILTIITNTEKDHMHILGDSIEKIAKEKAGIIKPGVPIITMENGEGFRVIKQIASEKNAPFYQVNREGEYIKTNLNGSFQQLNARLAIKAIEILRKDYNISNGAIKGLENVNIHGRMEFIDNILLDCAHNLPAFEILEKEIENIRQKYKKIIVVTTILIDKQRKGMLSIINNIANDIIITSIDFPRSSKPEELQKFITKPSRIIEDPKDALREAYKKADKNDLVLVAGSCYLIGEIIEFTKRLVSTKL